MKDGQKYFDADEERVKHGKLMSLGGGIGAPVFGLGGLALLFFRSRKKT